MPIHTMAVLYDRSRQAVVPLVRPRPDCSDHAEMAHLMREVENVVPFGSEIQGHLSSMPMVHLDRVDVFLAYAGCTRFKDN